MDKSGHNAGWSVAAVCVAGPALVALIPMAAAPSLQAMAKHFGATADSQLFSQIVMTLPAAVLVLASPLAGLLAGRIGHRAVLLASLILFVIGGAGVLFIQSRVSLIVLRLILGVAGGGVLTSSLGLIGAHFSGHMREKVLGYATSAASLLAGLALIYGGRLVDIGGWKAPFSLYLLGLPVLLFAWIVIQNPGANYTEKHSERLSGELRKVSPYYGLLILLTLAMFTPSIQAGFILEARGIGSAETIGSVIAATSFVAMVSAWAFGFLRSRIGLHGFLALDALSMGAGIMLIGLASQTWVIFLGCALVGVGAGMSEPATASIIFRRTSPIVHALAMGLIVSALNAGQFLNPLMFDPIRRVVGASGAFLVLGTILITVGLFITVRNRSDFFEGRQD